MKKLKVIEIDETQRNFWDEQIEQFEIVHPLNAFGWGKVRAIDGWKPSYFIAFKGEQVSGMIMVLTAPVPGIGLSVMYAPKGPVWNPQDNETLKALLNKVKEVAIENRAIFLRIDPNIKEDYFITGGDPFIKEDFHHLEYRWSFWNSPRDVYRINLLKSQDIEDLLNSFDRQARKAIRNSGKRGLSIRVAEDLNEHKEFYEIFKDFSVEKGFMSRGYDYQRSLWDEFVLKKNGKLFLARYNDKIISGIICLTFAQKCLAMHIGTQYKFQNLRTSDALFWECIKSAKENGCSWFSFRGVGSSPAQEKFKRKYGPDIVSLIGYYDLAYKPLIYRLCQFGEFEVLPRTWKALMNIRKQYESLAGKFRTKDSANVTTEL